MSAVFLRRKLFIYACLLHSSQQKIFSCMRVCCIHHNTVLPLCVFAAFLTKFFIRECLLHSLRRSSLFVHVSCIPNNKNFLHPCVVFALFFIRECLLHSLKRSSLFVRVSRIPNKNVLHPCMFAAFLTTMFFIRACFLYFTTDFFIRSSLLLHSSQRSSSYVRFSCISYNKDIPASLIA